MLLTIVSAYRDQGKSARTKQQHYVAALMQRKLDCRNWRLVLTGHSLGAGAAALIALHLKGRFASEACSQSPPAPGISAAVLSSGKKPTVAQRQSPSLCASLQGCSIKVRL